MFVEGGEEEGSRGSSSDSPSTGVYTAQHCSPKCAVMLLSLSGGIPFSLMDPCYVSWTTVVLPWQQLHKIRSIARCMLVCTV